MLDLWLPRLFAPSDIVHEIILVTRTIAIQIEISKRFKICSCRLVAEQEILESGCRIWLVKGRLTAKMNIPCCAV